ncbi:MAG: hypothetical protein IPJ13_23470 [Saprospiraceae bacterium]|nr:hypothetical protein [Saprospiraceae bacterium]
MRPARMSPVLEDSLRRIDRVKAINPVPNFGTGVSMADFETSINELRTELGLYNTSIGLTDQRLTRVKKGEKKVQ